MHRCYRSLINMWGFTSCNSWSLSYILHKQDIW